MLNLQSKQAVAEVEVEVEVSTTTACKRSSFIRIHRNNNIAHILNATMKSLLRPLRSCNGRPYLSYPSRTFSQHMRRARHASPSAHKWSHPPSSTVIADDDVASLASKSLHALSLADLVKYGALHL